MLTLAYPYVLLLLPLALLLRPRRVEPSSVAAPHLPIHGWLSRLPGVGISTPTGSRWRKLILLLAWIALVIALARPQHVGKPVNLSLSGRDLLLVVDISPSMQTHDMVMNNQQVSRLDAVKEVVADFIAHRKGDRIGLELFGTQPYIQAPLTFDHKTVQTQLDESQPGMAGRATSIGDAIGLAVKRLKDRPQKERVVVLLTDGANTAGQLPPAKAAAIAADAHVKIYTIGIGADSMQQQGFFGMQTINPSADLDAQLLKKIASKTGGQYFRAKNTPELAQIYQAIDQLEPINLQSKQYRPTTELFVWPLGVAVILFLLVIFARAIPLPLRPGQRQNAKEEVNHG
ncbi:vWA domain-containing protein [Mangrovitalea sediminis]|uniref:vWA domain-containing protein n=1 Tax=Mangrovitalea sediminis TaxID=1982043 RepID=UPI000BE5FF3D|nr:VWA domain-containing protein [Mangrovitalea sediminis]